MFLCRCTKCNNVEKYVLKSDLMNHKSEACASCGNKIHGLSHTRIHKIWMGIKDRCYRTNREDYKKYGAKDIKLVSSDIVMPRLLETIKWIIKSYSYKDISSKHNEIKNITIQEANKILKPIGIELQEINRF